MDAVVPWQALIALIEPHYPKTGSKGGRPTYPLATMLRIHLMQQWDSLSDPAMEDALIEVPTMRRFAGIDRLSDRIPDETSILAFRHLLENHELGEQIVETVKGHLKDRGMAMKQGTIIDVTLNAAPSSRKNKAGERDPDMHQTKKGNQWSFGMKIHAGVDKDTDLIHSIVTAAVNVHCKVNVLAALTNSVPGAASAACDSMIRGVVCPNEAIHGYKKAKGGIRSP